MASSRTPGQRYGSLTEAATYLGVTDRYLRDQIAAGRLTGYRLGSRNIRIDFDELDRLLRVIPTVGTGDQ